MQLITRTRLTGAIVFLLFLTACHKANKQGRYIPKDAAVIMQIDNKSLMSKLPWEEVKQTSFFKEMYSDTSLPPAVKNLLDKPEKSGIDLESDLLFFVQKDNSVGYVALEGNIKDAALFKEFNKQITAKGTESEADGVSYISHSSTCVGWNKDRFVYVFDAPAINKMDQLSRRMQNDSIDANTHSRDMSATCKTIFDLKEDNSLAKEDKFSALLKETGDIHFWINSESLYKNGISTPELAMLNLEKLYKGSITTATVNFDNGKIAFKSKSYSGEDLTKLYKKYSGGKINEEMIKRVPGKDMAAVIAINFKPEAIKELVKLLNLDGLANMGLAQMGFTLDDFVNANKGDVVIALSDIVMKKDSITMIKPEPTYFFSVSIGDKEAFNKLINAGKKVEQQMGMTQPPFAYNSNGTYFTISNSKENVDKYLGGASGEYDFLNKINGQPFGGYINIQKLMNAFADEAVKDSSEKAIFDASVKMWDRAYWKGGDMDGNAVTQSAELTLIDKNTNSLKQLNQYINTVSEIHLAQKKKNAALETVVQEDVQKELVQ